MLIVAGSHLMRMDYIVEEGYNLLHIYAEPPFAQLKLRLNYPFLTLVDLHMNGVKDNPTSALKELASEANFLATNRMGPVIEENVKQCHDVAMVNIKEYSSQDERIYSTVNINGIFQMQGLYRSLSVPKDIIPYLPVVSGLDFKKKFEEKAAEFLITSNLMDNIANSKYVAFVNHYSDPKMERYWNSGLIQPNYRIGEHEDYVLYADSLCGIVLPIQHRPDYTVLGGSLVVANDLRLGTNGNHEGRIIREIRPGVTYNEVFSHPQLVEYRSNKVIYMLTHVHGTIMPVVDEYAPFNYGESIIYPAGDQIGNLYRAALLHHRMVHSSRSERNLFSINNTTDAQDVEHAQTYYPMLFYEPTGRDWASLQQSLPHKQSLFN